MRFLQAPELDLRRSYSRQACPSAEPPIRQRSSSPERLTHAIFVQISHTDACNLSSTGCHTPKAWPRFLATMSHLDTSLVYCSWAFI